MTAVYARPGRTVRVRAQIGTMAKAESFNVAFFRGA